jgi:hypothetical protein
MRSNVKLLVILVVGALALSCIITCGHSDTAGSVTDQVRFPWTITVEKWKVLSSLKGDLKELQYDGTERKQAYEQKPTLGMVFLIIDLALDKQKGSTTNFSWKDVYVQDFRGERYYRHRNDGFLVLFDMKMINAVDLNFGEHRGSVCFELPERVAKEALNFVHETSAGKNIIQLK